MSVISHLEAVTQAEKPTDPTCLKLLQQFQQLLATWQKNIIRNSFQNDSMPGPDLVAEQ